MDDELLMKDIKHLIHNKCIGCGAVANLPLEDKDWRAEADAKVILKILASYDWKSPEEAEKLGKVWGIASLTLLVAEIQGCENMDEVKRLVSSWVKANNLEPEKVETYQSLEELEQALKDKP